jgi:hypothetical protein
VSASKSDGLIVCVHSSNVTAAVVQHWWKDATINIVVASSDRSTSQQRFWVACLLDGGWTAADGTEGQEKRFRCEIIQNGVGKMRSVRI